MDYKIKGEARAARQHKARFAPTGGVSTTIAAQHGPHAGKALAKAQAVVRVRLNLNVKGGK